MFDDVSTRRGLTSREDRIAFDNRTFNAHKPSHVSCNVERENSHGNSVNGVNIVRAVFVEILISGDILSSVVFASL